MASHLGLPLQDVQNRTTSTEFVEWNRFLDDQVNAFHREDAFWAQIAAEVRRSSSSKPERVRDEDFMIKFKLDTGEDKEESSMEASKRFWFRGLGLKVE